MSECCMAKGLSWMVAVLPEQEGVVEDGEDGEDEAHWTVEEAKPEEKEDRAEVKAVGGGGGGGWEVKEENAEMKADGAEPRK